MHGGLVTAERDSIRYEFNRPGGVSVLVLAYGSSSEGLNLHPQCYNTIVVEQGKDYTMEHQAWSRIRRIGKKELLKKTMVGWSLTCHH